VRTRALLTAAVLLATGSSVGLPGLVAPAAAHSVDPRIVTVIDSVVPPLPADVVVQAQAGVATQLVVANPTATLLVVAARGGEDFLRISSAGVEANLESPEFYATSNPVGSSAATPQRVREGGGKGAPRFVRIGSTSSWGWYDHRLHPADLAAPADATRPARLGDFTVPLRYGDTAVEVRGHVEFRPLQGAFDVTADLAPDALAGVTVQVLQSSKLPGLFLTNGDTREFTVLGRDGEPFARFGPRGLEVNAVSRTRVEDQLARGADAGPPAAEPRFELLGGTRLSWLDARLRWKDAAPPDEALRRDEPTVLGRWEVPVEVDGARVALTGEIRWVPTGASLVSRDDGRSPLLLAGGGVLVALVLGGTVLLVRRARTA
jgi:hypothetical protein